MQPGKDFTKDRVEGLRGLSRFPLVYDDVSLHNVTSRQSLISFLMALSPAPCK